MRKKWRFFRGGHSEIFALTMTFIFAAGSFIISEPARGSEASTYEVFSLKNITADQGKKYLAEIITGTVTNPYGPSALLVTTSPKELTKAKAILKVVDCQEKYAIKTLLPASAVRNMPSNDQIAAKLSPSLTKGISIGSFSAPPSEQTGTKVIIDIHNDSVVAVAPVALLDTIASVVAQFQETGRADVQNSPIIRASRTTPQASTKQKAAELNEPSAAKFIFAANGEIQTDPNAAAATPDQPAGSDATTGKYELPPIPNGEEVVNLALADLEKLTIIEFLGLVGPYLHLDFMYDPRVLVGEVTINPNGKWRGPVKVKDLYPLLEFVLQFNGFVMTRGKGNLVAIVPEADAFNIDPALLDSDKIKIEQGDGVVTRIFKLEHIDVASAQNLLTGMRLSTNITPINEIKTLIVTGYAYRMPRIQALLDIIDKPGKPKKFRFRQLQYTMAQTLAPKLQTLAEQLGTVSITVTETSTTQTTTTSPKRPNETEAQYQARLRAEAAALARQRAAAIRTATTARTPEPTSTTVYLDADNRTNRILMIGLNEQLDEVEELIDTLDVAQQDLRTLESYKIEHVDAEDVRKKLAELGIITDRLTTPYSSRITDPTKPVPGTTPTTTTRPTTAAGRAMMYDETNEVPIEEPQVVVIEPTNSLLVNATAEQHDQIVKILKYADAETDRMEIPYKVYPLENQSPEHLASVLEPLIQENILDKEGKVESVRQKQEEMITIVPDPNTFSLVVYASKKNQEWIASLVEQLDQRRPQVLIDVTLVQISKTDAFNYDLNIISSFPDLTNTSGLTSAIIPGAQGGNLVSGLMNSGRDRFVDMQSNGGNATGFYGDKHINALLTMMQQKDYGRVLAKPKILVNDNEAGTISTIDRTYVTKTSSIPVSGGGAGQDTTLIQTAVDYADYPAGITLEIVPHISRGDFLRLDITLDRSDFGTITGDKPPDTTESNIKTTVTVPDQSTIILGGLLKLNQSKGGTKVPILGDIPLVGGLFRSASNSDIQRNLYVFVKAEIIKPETIGLAQGGMHSISERNRDSFEKRETEFQEYNDWPGISPKNMDPLKVLDAQ